MFHFHKLFMKVKQFIIYLWKWNNSQLFVKVEQFIFKRLWIIFLSRKNLIFRTQNLAEAKQTQIFEHRAGQRKQTHIFEHRAWPRKKSVFRTHTKPNQGKNISDFQTQNLAEAKKNSDFPTQSQPTKTNSYFRTQSLAEKKSVFRTDTKPDQGKKSQIFEHRTWSRQKKAQIFEHRAWPRQKTHISEYISCPRKNKSQIFDLV